MKLERQSDNSWVFNDPKISFEAHEESDYATDLWHSGDVKNAEREFLSIIEKYPTHIDAIHHYSLLLDAESRAVEAYLACRAAVSIGLEVIPSDFSWETSGLVWGSLDNRPFMRAYHNLGLKYLDQNRLEKAEEIFTRLLSVNPNDNQGIRYILPKIWFEQSKHDLIVAHCSENDEATPEISYSNVLALVMLNRYAEAKEAIQIAVNDMPLVRKELLKKRHPRPKGMRNGHVTLGGQDQAYVYWEEYGKYWSSSVPAMELLLRS